MAASVVLIFYLWLLYSILAALPADIYSLNKLRELFTLIPADTAQVLVLDYNSLTALEGVCALAKLERLSAAHNALAALPSDIGSLKRLRQLNVSSNQLAALPIALGRCESLEQIDAADNRLQVCSRD